MNKRFVFTIALIPIVLSAQETVVQYDVTSEVVAGNGDFTPLYMVANRHGIVSNNSNTGFLRTGVAKKMDSDKNIAWAAALDLAAAYNSYNNVWVQQLYADVKLYCFELSGGMKEFPGTLKNQELSSGSLVWSGNVRPIPQLRISIPNFVSVPFTDDWLQIKGSLSYGKFLDDQWLKDSYSYKEGYLTTGSWYHQKQLFFRTKESNKFIMTFGGEFACQFEGDYSKWNNGVEDMESREKSNVKIKDFFNVLIPVEGSGDTYYKGNHVGSWHIIAEYKINSKHAIKVNTEWLFEDGSGIGKMNGWDGLWGLEYSSSESSLLSNVLFEYLQTTNQSGPIHFAPGDFPGTPVNSQATGADDYYNNYYYNGWANYGMSIGSAMIKSPAYNKDGYLRYKDNRVKMFHLGLKGTITKSLNYRILSSWIDSWGTPFLPADNINSNFSFMLELNYKPVRFDGLQFSIKGAMDNGSLYGNNTAVSIALKKSGKLL